MGVKEEGLVKFDRGGKEEEQEGKERYWRGGRRCGNRREVVGRRDLLQRRRWHRSKSASWFLPGDTAQPSMQLTGPTPGLATLEKDKGWSFLVLMLRMKAACSK